MGRLYNIHSFNKYFWSEHQGLRMLMNKTASPGSPGPYIPVEEAGDKQINKQENR